MDLLIIKLLMKVW